MAWGYNLQLTSVTVKGQPSAAICIYWLGVSYSLLFPSLPQGWLSSWSPLHAFLYSNKDSFFAPYTNVHPHPYLHPHPHSHRGTRTQRLDTSTASIVYQGIRGFWMLLPKPTTFFCQVLSLIQWHLEGQRGQIQMGLISNWIGHSLVSIKQFWCRNHFIWNTQGLEESLSLVELKMGKWYWNVGEGREVASWKNPGALCCQGWCRHSPGSWVLGEWRALSPHQVSSPCFTLKPLLLHKTGTVCRHQPPVNSLACSYASRCRYPSASFRSHPTPSTECPAFYSSLQPLFKSLHLLSQRFPKSIHLRSIFHDLTFSVITDWYCY